MARESFPKRQYNSQGGPVDIANHKWVRQNLQLYGDATTLVAKAFSTDDPFAALGYAEDIQTRRLPNGMPDHVRWTRRTLFRLKATEGRHWPLRSSLPTS
jgi:hypothetical protein